MIAQAMITITLPTSGDKHPVNAILFKIKVDEGRRQHRDAGNIHHSDARLFQTIRVYAMTTAIDDDTRPPAFLGSLFGLIYCLLRTLSQLGQRIVRQIYAGGKLFRTSERRRNRTGPDTYTAGCA